MLASGGIFKSAFRPAITPSSGRHVSGRGYGRAMWPVALRDPRGGELIVEVARDRRRRRYGLRPHTRLDPANGMLFERCRSVHTMGMRFPITVAFLDGSWRVLRVTRAPANRVLFCLRARHTLECHIAVDIRVGDVLSRRAAPASRTTRDGPGIGRPPRT